MFISPQVAIDGGWISGFVDPATQIQPNAIDFTLDRLFTIDHSQPFHISNDEKMMRGGKEVLPDSNHNWTLTPDTVYDGMSSMYVNIPEGVAALLVIRSTLNRNGLFITSGLYDSMFTGHIGFALHNRSGPAIIERETRVGQIIFVESTSVGGYAGGYNHAPGTHATIRDCGVS